MSPTEDRDLRVALLGGRGVPGRYGGYETLMDELAGRLVARGVEVTVYCRSHYTDRGRRTYRGARLVVLPTVRTKHLDTPVHTLLSALHGTGQGYDAALVVNAANALFVPLLRAGGVPTALHVDGIERRRKKWGALGRGVYAVSERMAGLVADTVVSDARVIQEHYRARYGVESALITYGVDPEPPRGREVLDELGLISGRFFLYVSRFEPENNPHRVAEAYRRVEGDLPLVMVGDAPYADRFIASFREDADPRIRFPGAIYGDGYRQLLSHALAYVHATEVGGTHPALVEAMGYGNCVVANDTPENREVAGPEALYFRAQRPGELADLLESIRRDPGSARRTGKAMSDRARRLFDWDRITDRYLTLFRRLASG
ncbi:MAG: glycosyltransferase [Thermoanaerobaculia bacterium]|nr:glycosyltransferase [Thermoanaerobaculia bacterium]